MANRTRNNRFFIGHIPDNDWHILQTCQLAGSVAAMARNNLIATIRVRAHKARRTNTALFNTIQRFLHLGVIILETVRLTCKWHLGLHSWIPFKVVQLCKGDTDNSLFVGFLTFLLRGKKIIYRCQLYFFRAAFQVSSPPASDFCSSQPPCRQGHGQKCSCPRR